MRQIISGTLPGKKDPPQVLLFIIRILLIYLISITILTILLKCSYEYRPSDDSHLVLLNVESQAHILHAFVNGEFVGQYPIR